MAVHEVLQPFRWYPDGCNVESLKVGDKRDFDSLADGLKKAKLIGDPEAAPEKEEPTKKETENGQSESGAEAKEAEQSQEEPKPRRGRPKSADK